MPTNLTPFTIPQYDKHNNPLPDLWVAPGGTDDPEDDTFWTTETEAWEHIGGK